MSKILENFFGVSKPIIGMLHLAGTDYDVVSRALRETEIYEACGVDGVIVENYHTSSKEIMKKVLNELSARGGKIVSGVNVLPNCAVDAMNMATEFGAKFVQVDAVSGRYSGRETMKDLEEFMNVREKTGLFVFGGVWPKYYSPVKNSDLREDLIEGMKRCDSIVVTGNATGKETPIEKIKKFREVIEDFPLTIGAGLNSNNVREQMQIADAGIVGSSFKLAENTLYDVVRKRVEEFMEEVRKVRS